MVKFLSITIFLITFSFLQAQDAFDAPMKKKHMKKDLMHFKEIREIANSGVFKYRSKAEIDSIYRWAFNQINESNSIGDFYNILSTITDFEGSLHNDTGLPKKVRKRLWDESSGYFPLMIKYIQGNWICNNDSIAIPLGSKIKEINGISMSKIIPELYLYYTTDGYNITGKQIGINSNFSFYYRWRYGKKDQFNIKYETIDGTMYNATLSSVSNIRLRELKTNRHSLPFDYLLFSNYIQMTERNELYKTTYNASESNAILKINSFYIGADEKDPVHITYAKYLDSIFTVLKQNGTKNLIVDVRFNGGGTAPNDMVTGSYLINKPMKDVKQAWTSCNKLPQVGKLNIPFYQKPFANIAVRKEVKKNLSLGSDGKYYYNKFKTIEPNPNAFKGKIYLLVGPNTASAASMFAAMVAGNTDAIVIGDETQGGYYGHNGIFPVSYVLPKSKIEFDFSMVNIDQNVRQKDKQPKGSGIIPEFIVTQAFDDFLKNEDTVMKFVEKLISEDKTQHSK